MNDALYYCILKIEENINALVSEWSKEVDLRPTVFARMGSNPIECNVYFFEIILSFIFVFIHYV